MSTDVYIDVDPEKDTEDTVRVGYLALILGAHCACYDQYNILSWLRLYNVAFPVITDTVITTVAGMFSILKTHLKEMEKTPKRCDIDPLPDPLPDYWNDVEDPEYIGAFLKNHKVDILPAMNGEDS